MPDTHTPDESVTFRWNGRRLVALRGDTLAIALWRNGIRALGYSRKRHRPLGTGGPAMLGALVTVNGLPHLHADQCLIEQGMEAHSQGGWPHRRFDLLVCLRFLPPRWLRGGAERPYGLRSGTRRFEWWERLLMTVAGGADPPDQGIPSPRGRRIDCDVLVIGGGPQGVQAANSAAARGERVCLITRSCNTQTWATAWGVPPLPLDPRVEALFGHEAVGVYRQGRVVLAAPPAADQPAIVVVCQQLTLAVGRQSLGPLTQGSDLPGVLDARTALRWATRLGQALGPTIIVGTGVQDALAERLRALGVTVLAAVPLERLRRILGRHGVKGIRLDDQTMRCHTLVHAGPWHTDRTLTRQAAAAGTLRLDSTSPGEIVTPLGDRSADAPWPLAALVTEPIPVCSCMDVTADELCALWRQGVQHSEELKRRTSCGMGPCQGQACWPKMLAVLTAVSGRPFEDLPSARPPGRGLTVAQAAGLDGLIECE